MCRTILSALLLATLLNAPLFAKTKEDARPTSATAAIENNSLKFVRIWPSWRSADSFLRISEYFGGGENRSSQTILRSQPAERSGFYFLTRIKNAEAALPDAHFELQIIRPDSPHAVTYRFPSTIETGSHVYLLGLTGSDWPDFNDKPAEDVHPVSWRLRILDSQARELLHSESFLWAQPQE